MTKASRGLRVWVVGYLFMAVMVATGLPTPLYPLYKERLGLTSLDITGVYAAYAIVVLVVLLGAGGLSDHMGRRRVLLLAVVVTAAGEVALLAVPDVPGLYAGRVLSGVSTGLVLGSATAYLAELAGPEGARRAAAGAVVANLGGQALGTALAGTCARYLPAPTALPYVAGLVMLTPVALLWLLAIPETVSHAGNWRQGLRLPAIKVPPIIRVRFWVTAAALVAAFSLLGFLTALTGAILTEATRHPGPLIAGLVTASLFLSATVVQLGLPERAFRHASIMGLACLPLCALLLATAAVAGSMPALVGAVLLTGAAVGVTLRAGIAGVLAQCPSEERGSVSSALYVAVYTGASIPTIAAGLVATMFGLTPAVISLGAFVSLLAVLAATISLRSSRPLSALT